MKVLSDWYSCMSHWQYSGKAYKNWRKRPSGQKCLATGPGARGENYECNQNRFCVSNPPVCYSLPAFKDEIDCQHLSVKKGSHILCARPTRKWRAGEQEQLLFLVPHLSQAKGQQWYRPLKKKKKKDKTKKEVKPGRNQNGISCEEKQTFNKDVCASLHESTDFPSYWSAPLF